MVQPQMFYKRHWIGLANWLLLWKEKKAQKETIEKDKYKKKLPQKVGRFQKNRKALTEMLVFTSFF